MYNKEKGQVVEVYAYQFGWLVRYAGVDNQLGEANYKLVTSANPLGVIKPNLLTTHMGNR